MSGLAVYVHYPFCRRKCPYCDYNSHVRDGIPHRRWQQAYLEEIRYFAERLPNRRIGSVFFGGGTPSLLPVETIHVILDEIFALWPPDADCEVTLEVNPSFLDRAIFREWRQAGVNRLSLGVQALDDAGLRLLGRDHTVAQALQVVSQTAEVFERYSLDMMYGRLTQSLQDWSVELGQVLSLRAPHLSLYRLTIEPETAYWTQQRRGAIRVPQDEEAASFYRATRDQCLEHGMEHYEVSSFAAQGQYCRHNLSYWRYQEYLGIGPGAHGRLFLDGRRAALQQTRFPEHWLVQVEKNGHGTDAQTPLSCREQAEECLILGLRLYQGLSAQRFIEITGQTFESFFPENRWQPLVQGGLLVLDRDIRLSEQGFYYMDRVHEQLLT